MLFRRQFTGGRHTCTCTPIIFRNLSSGSTVTWMRGHTDSQYFAIRSWDHDHQQHLRSFPTDGQAFLVWFAEIRLARHILFFFVLAAASFSFPLL